MLPTRDPPQDKRPTQTEREGLETKFPSKQTEKKVGIAILISDKIDFRKRAIKRDPEDHFIILKGRIHEEDINIVNIYAPNTGVPKYIKKILEGSRKILTATRLQQGILTPHCQKMDRPSKQSINKYIDIEHEQYPRTLNNVH